MQDKPHPHPTIFVIFGAAGDLAWRKLIPALYNLFRDGWLPEQFNVFGVGRKEMALEAFRRHLYEGVNQFSRQGNVNEALWEKFASHLTYEPADLSASEAYSELNRRLLEMEKQWDTPANHVFYLALPPHMIAAIAGKLAEAGLNRERDRLVVEKPFGRDLDSARELNRHLTGLFQESQIFRIDHYLGKETVQNLLAFRFADTIFEPIWNRLQRKNSETRPFKPVQHDHQTADHERNDRRGLVESSGRI